VAVDENVVHGRVCKQGLERSEAEDLVDQFVDETAEFLRTHRGPFIAQRLVDEGGDLTAQFFRLDLVDHRKVQPVEEGFVKNALQLEPLREGDVFGRRQIRRDLGDPRSGSKRHDLIGGRSTILGKRLEHLPASYP